MTAADLPRLRLFNQRLEGDKPDTPGAVVSWLGAVQAQDYAGAKRSVALRMPAATDADIERAVAAGEIVRTWPMRGTLHFVARADVRWILALAAPHVVSRSAPRYRQLELDAETFSRGFDLLLKALEGGQQLTRAELNALFEGAGIETRDQRSYHILSRAGMEGLICFGPMRGKQPTFVRLDDWVPEAEPLDADGAMAELARRYFTGHGPATQQDFAWWCGLPAAVVRGGIEAAASDLISETIAGKTYWRADAPPDTLESPTAHLLPGFDEYLLGYTDRSAVLDPRFAPLVNNQNGVFSALVVVDGQAAGTWKRVLRRQAVEITFAPFRPWGDAERAAIERAAYRYASFLGLPVMFG